MDDPKVSVCMVTYNQERYIAQAVESVLAQQTTFPVELVIGEDCSTDGTREIARDFAGRHPDQIRLLPADQNLGANRNFMRTFKACRGQYVAMQEGDDFWTSPHKLQRQVDVLDARPDWAICFHPAQVLFEDREEPPMVWPVEWTRTEATLADLFVVNFIPTNSVLFRNGLFADFPPWFGDIVIGDWPLHMLNAMHGNIGFLPEAMSTYRVHSGGMFSSMSRGRQMAAIFNMLSTVDRHFAGKYAAEIDQRRLNYLYEILAAEAAATQAASDRALLLEECRRLTEENLALRHAARHSLTNIIAREASRPAKQLWNKLHGRPAKSPRGSHAA